MVPGTVGYYPDYANLPNPTQANDARWQFPVVDPIRMPGVMPVPMPVPMVPVPVAMPFGYGYTSREQRERNIEIAKHNKVYEPQNIAPTDPDMSRMYWVRELDGSWAQHSRLTIESGDIGAFTWYIDNDGGAFYAALKPNDFTNGSTSRAV